MNRTGQALWPVDFCVIGYNVGLAVLWSFGWTRADVAPWMTVGHLLLAALPFLFRRIGWPRSRPVGVVHQLYPLVLAIVYWPEADLIRRTFHSGAHDALVLGLEKAAVGVHLHEIWMPAMPNLWISEPMHLLYWMYYPMVFLTPLILVVRGREEVTRDVVFNIFVTYAACYILFTLFPVDGPRFTMDRFMGAQTAGILYRVDEWLHAGGDALGAAFPSSHVAGSAIVTFLAFRWFSRRTALIFLVGLIGVAVSTVYTQNHYASDSVSGLLLGMVCFWVLAPVLARLVVSDQSSVISH